MLLSKFPVLVALLFIVCMSKFASETLGDVMPSSAECLNCSKCESPCKEYPPAVSGYPSDGTPPSPSAASPPPASGYAIYGAPPPPPPPPHSQGQSKCPPAPGAQCCTPPFPYTISPPNPYTMSPPNPYTMSPPNPYTYVPYGGGNSATKFLLPTLVPLMMLSSSFVFLF